MTALSLNHLCQKGQVRARTSAGVNPMTVPKLLQEILEAFQSREEVDAILLAGSRGRTRLPDAYSDFDLYIYTNEELEIEFRRRILEPRTSVLELGNQYWELEDDGVLNDGFTFELIYREVSNFITRVEACVLSAQATVGYSTCLWHNLLDSYVLFDRSGRLGELQVRLDVPFPRQLQESIFQKNWPLLMKSTCSFYNQAKLALKRQDWVSLQHRTAGFLASVFDLVFAANGARHPGEKHQLEAALELASVPPYFAQRVGSLAGPEAQPKSIGTAMEALSVEMGIWLSSKGYPTGAIAPIPAQPTQDEQPTQVATVYTDGGCIGNPGKGAWAYLIDDGSEVAEGTGGERFTTNNKMELQAVIEALKALFSRAKKTTVVVYTDSQYVRNGITTWIKSWEANGWRTASKEPVKNKDLWVELQHWDKVLAPQWKWVKGHAGNPQNERCDALVRQTMQNLPR